VLPHLPTEILAMSGETQPEVMPPGTPHRISPEISNHEPPMHIPRPSSDRAQVHYYKEKLLLFAMQNFIAYRK